MVTSGAGHSSPIIHHSNITARLLSCLRLGAIALARFMQEGGGEKAAGGHGGGKLHHSVKGLRVLELGAGTGLTRGGAVVHPLLGGGTGDS